MPLHAGSRQSLRIAPPVCFRAIPVMPPDVFQCAHHGKEQPVLAVIFFRFTRYPRFADVVHIYRARIQFYTSFFTF